MFHSCSKQQSEPCYQTLLSHTFINCC